MRGQHPGNDNQWSAPNMSTLSIITQTSETPGQALLDTMMRYLLGLLGFAETNIESGFQNQTERAGQLSKLCAHNFRPEYDQC